MIAKKKIVMLFSMFYVLLIGGCSLKERPKTLTEYISNKTFTFQLIDNNGKTANNEYGIIHFSDNGKYFYNTSSSGIKKATEKFDDLTDEKGGLSQREEQVNDSFNYTVIDDTILLSRGIGKNGIGKNLYNLTINDDESLTGEWGSFIAMSSSTGFIDCKVVLKEK
ncbi:MULTISPECIES: hypothetical protein [Vagococcus]|uniref:Lipoprotein n=1 Tax=Vagococcus fluvialis bH819 TaxID=1255619 RepID=A0A1X6WLD4_9ENTE|nr:MULTISPECIES: hypothetical protein [Vagococcus]SLM85151.1 hypothetical protein FM121_03570 [Vagococcus fluvialis bH819]HCM88436.1 hypothetical protein [Vagococcus sp.]